jgi:hypothetical protein
MPSELLPKGWKPKWSNTRKCFYYWNSANGQVSWQKPVATPEQVTVTATARGRADARLLLCKGGHAMALLLAAGASAGMPFLPCLPRQPNQPCFVCTHPAVRANCCCIAARLAPCALRLHAVGRNAQAAEEARADAALEAHRAGLAADDANRAEDEAAAAKRSVQGVFAAPGALPGQLQQAAGASKKGKSMTRRLSERLMDGVRRLSIGNAVEGDADARANVRFRNAMQCAGGGRNATHCAARGSRFRHLHRFVAPVLAISCCSLASVSSKPTRSPQPRPRPWSPPCYAPPPPPPCPLPAGPP